MPDMTGRRDYAARMSAPRQFMALAQLGFRATIAHPLQKLFRPPSQRGKDQFIRNYASEGLVPTTAPDAASLTSFMRCIDCGLCDMVCPLVGKLERRDFSGPSIVALAYSRATPDLEIVSSTLRHLPTDCGSCTQCVDICPTHVPLLDLFSYANRKLDEVRTAKAGATLALPSGTR